MKRLVSLLLVICMLVPCLAFAEQDAFTQDDAIVEDVFTEVPDEIIDLPVEDEDEIVLPEDDDLIMMPNEGVDGPDPFRELVLLQPTDLVGSAASVNNIRLTWSPVTFASRYDVLRKLGGESEYSLLSSTPSNQLYYEDTSVTPGQVVYYRVQAMNVSYNGDEPVTVYSPPSNTLPFITLKAPVLADPRGMDADSIRLNWSSVSGASTYEVEMASSAAGPFSPARKDLTGALCDINGLTSGTGYYFRVRAVRTFSSGEVFYSDWSNVGCGTPMERPVLTVTPDGTNAILSWNACAGATNYIIYRKIEDGAYNMIAKVENVTSYIDANRTPGEVCYYFVYASCPIGDYNCFSLSSDHIYFTVVGGVVINAVQNTGNRQQTIDWTGVDGSTTIPGASHFLVYSATSQDGLYAEIGKTTATTFVVNDLEPGKTYYYKVRTVREFSNGTVMYGPWSNIMSMPEAGQLQLDSLSGANLTYQQLTGADITGGYTGDVFAWSVNAFGGSGEYTFRWSLVPISGGTGIVLKDFSDGYVAIEEGEASLTDTFALTLADQHISLINDQKYAIQVEVRDSLGETAMIKSCGDTYAELTFVAAKPTTRFINVTMRVGEKMTMEHGVYPEVGDTVLMDVSNPTGAVTLNGNEITAVGNGYATILVTPERFKNDVLIAYNITVGYASLAINSVTPSATTLNVGSALDWDINYVGGRAPYTVTCRVYRDAVLVAENVRTTNASGMLSVNYQPSIPSTYYLEVTVTATDGQTATKRSVVTTVVPYEPLTVAPDVTSAEIGDTITWKAEYTGTGSIVRYDYTLYRDGTKVASTTGGNEATFAYKPTEGVSHVLQVVGYEANGNTIQISAAAVAVKYSADYSGNGNGKVNGVRVALRKGPSTSYGVILRVDKGQYVNVIKTQGSWYYIEYKGQKGWMMSRYITMQN